LNPTLHTAALAALEVAINRALTMDLATAQGLQKLAGTVFQLELVGTGANIYLLPQHQGVELRGFYDGPIDSHVIGTVPDFIELVSSEDPASTLINGGIQLSGDSAPLLQLQRLLHRLDIDWEGSLAKVVGDLPAHQLGRMVRGGVRWGRQAINSMNRQAEEFLHEEARLLPPSAELQDFYEAVTRLDVNVDRAEARLRKLQQRLAKLSLKSQQMREQGN
jgi:ubiquinone biosynthesis protein UbiJ